MIFYYLKNITTEWSGKIYKPYIVGESTMYIITFKTKQNIMGEALSYACHIFNRLPSTSLNRITFLKLWSSSFVNNYDSIRVFRYLTYYHITESKPDPRANTTIYLGFSKEVKATNSSVLNQRQ